MSMRNDGPMTRKVSVADAKDNLSSIIHEIELGSRVEIARLGLTGKVDLLIAAAGGP